MPQQRPQQEETTDERQETQAGQTRRRAQPVRHGRQGLLVRGTDEPTPQTGETGEHQEWHPEQQAAPRQAGGPTSADTGGGRRQKTERGHADDTDDRGARPEQGPLDQRQPSPADISPGEGSAGEQTGQHEEPGRHDGRPPAGGPPGDPRDQLLGLRTRQEETQPEGAQELRAFQPAKRRDTPPFELRDLGARPAEGGAAEGQPESPGRGRHRRASLADETPEARPKPPARTDRGLRPPPLVFKLSPCSRARQPVAPAACAPASASYWPWS